MYTNLYLDDDLIDEVVRIGNFKTKSAAVNSALKAYVDRRLGILDLFGKIDYDPDYNYKDHRSRKKKHRRIHGNK